MQCETCRKPLRPVVAVDIDGTLGDYHSQLKQFAAQYWNKPDMERARWHGDCNMNESLGLTLEQYRETKLSYRQGGLKRNMPLMAGAHVLMQGLVTAGAEIWIATARPWARLDNVDPDTRWWLQEYKIPYDYIVYGDDKYRQLAEAVGMDRVVAVIDDLPEQLAMAAALFPDAAIIQPLTTHNFRARQGLGNHRHVVDGLFTALDVARANIKRKGIS